MRHVTFAHEVWPIAGSFTISRGSKTKADVVVARISEDGATGQGEAVPYPRYGETVEAALAALEVARSAIEAGAGRSELAHLITSMAARNAIDAALWDLEAKQKGLPVWQLAGLPEPRPQVTAYTISLGTAEEMAAAAAAAATRPLLKLKLGREGDAERLRAIRRAVPAARLIVDANEGWAPQNLPSLLAACAETGVELVEQPLPAGNDDALKGLARQTVICADESVHGLDSLDGLAGKYDCINIKLDKTGGLTPALALAREAERRGLRVMAGCMVGTSLAMAPAFMLAGFATVIDLDGPLLLARDREPGIRFDGSLMFPPPAALWG
jgi:L-alanine-DL-glutamate epimerase-like enolase superfamily enzyme